MVDYESGFAKWYVINGLRIHFYLKNWKRNRAEGSAMVT